MKKTVWLSAVLAVLAAGCIALSAPLTARAAGAKVTYKVPFMQDVVSDLNGIPEELSVSNIRGNLYGTNKPLVSDELDIKWYADSAYTTEYGFNQGESSDVTLYGKIVEKYRNFQYNGWGWEVRSGRIPTGDPIDNNYITNDSYVAPAFTDSATGNASFDFNGSVYSVYGRALRADKPFEINLNFNNVTPDGSTAWFLCSLFPSLTLAQTAMQAPWGNAGSGTVLMFNLANGGAPQTFGLGTPVAGVISTAVTEYPDGGNAFKSLFEGENTNITLTVEIGETGTEIKSGDKVVATSAAKRSDYPDGNVFLHFASVGSSKSAIGFDAGIRQTAGNITVGGTAVAGNLSVNGMSVKLPIDVQSGSNVKVTANGKEITFVKVYGEDGVYAIDIPDWGRDVSLDVSYAGTHSSSKEEGCKGASCGGSIALLPLFILPIVIKKRIRG